jgi:uncharacterized protein with HEPN domain
MSRTTQEYLQDILEHVQSIEEFTREGRQAFLADRKLSSR